MIINVDTVRGIIMETNNLNSSISLGNRMTVRYRLKISVDNEFYGVSVFYTDWVYEKILGEVLKKLANKINIYQTVSAELQYQSVEMSETVKIVGSLHKVQV